MASQDLLLLAAAISSVAALSLLVILIIQRRAHDAEKQLLLQRQQEGLQFAEQATANLAEKNEELSAKNTCLQKSEQLLAGLQAQATLQEKSLVETESKLSALSKLYSEQQVSSARIESEYKHFQVSSAEKMALLTDAKLQLSDQFEKLANRIFEEKHAKFQNVSKDSLESTLKPFREQMSAFRSRVDDIYDKENRERGELKEQLKNLQEMNSNISKEAQNLTRALKGDNKAQGNWGEVILEKVLEESGLRKGHEYETQQSFSDESGRRRQPDVIVRLPDEKDIIVDAKVSLIAYERYCSAEDDAERDLALREHINSVKQHISGLSTKAYQHIEGLRTLDFVFIFIPIESAFMTAFEHDPEMFRNAYEQNIIVVGPTTLLATLRTVQSIWRHERQNLNAEKIAKEAGALHDQFALVLQSLEDVGKHLNRGQEAYEKTLSRMSSGRGNLVGRVSRLEALGAKVKKPLPASLLERANIETGGEDSEELAD